MNGMTAKIENDSRREMVSHEQKKKVEDDQTPDVPVIFDNWKKQEGISW